MVVELNIFYSFVDWFPTIFFSVSTAGSAFKHWQKTHDSVNKMGISHVSELVSLTR